MELRVSMCLHTNLAEVTAAVLGAVGLTASQITHSQRGFAVICVFGFL